MFLKMFRYGALCANVLYCSEGNLLPVGRIVLQATFLLLYESDSQKVEKGREGISLLSGRFWEGEEGGP